MKKQFLQICGLLMLLMLAQNSHAQTTIFSYGSAWKYLDDGSNQGTAWTGTSFNDAAWVSDTGFFGYGDTWITKCVNACGAVLCTPTCTNKYITTYFRKVVNIPNTAIYDSMILSIKRDDGVVVYVNGVEVWRDNMPTGTITYTSLAPTAISEPGEYTPVTKSIPISFFVPGNNTIAVEVHQQSGTSSDLGFNMQMVGAPAVNILPFGTAWKYLDNGSDQGTAWIAPGFADASWSTGTGHIGYAETWTTTCVNSGCTPFSCAPTCTTKYITTYLRKVVNIPNPSLYDSVKLIAFRDDGIVVYVNGVEVWRDNMPAGTITYTTLAPGNITGTTGPLAESLMVAKTIPISAFVAGNNTIAVELHQNLPTSADLDFNMKLDGVPYTPPPPVSLAQGPYLQMGSQTAANVRWRTNTVSKSRLMVGTVLGTYPTVVNDVTPVTEHELRVTGLTPDTKYYYRFGTDTSILQGDSTNFFITAPSDTSTRRVSIAAFGDCGRNDNNFQTTSLTSYQTYLATKNMKAADLMILMGDNAYDVGSDAEFSANFFSRYSSNILKNHMLFPCPGNHDYANDATRQVDHNIPYYNLFTVPTAGECGGLASGTEAYYSYNWGNVHFLSLDSYGKENSGTTRLYDTSGAQVTWVKNDLAANTKKWVVAYWHHPPYSMGGDNSDLTTELINIRQNFIQILERYGVDVIICGHSHDYERSYLLKGHFGNEASFSKAAHTTDSSSAKYNGTTNSCPYMTPSGKVNHGTVYVVSGSSGADGGVQAGYPHNALPFAVDDGGMFYLDIQNNRLDAKFLRRDNTIADQFTIMKDVKVRDTIVAWPGTPVALTATWQGAYAWNTGATTRSVSIVTPNTDTLITVKDSLTNTCITDQHFIDARCTMPAFTVCPSNIVTGACNSTVTYSVADTATPNPTLSYTFTGATTGSGAGTGSGSVFNTGITNVTVTASNPCGSTNCTFTVTINPLPGAVVVSGGGIVCNNTTLTASNGGTGTIYFQGTTPGGTSTATPSVSQLITTTGTYYFRARGSDGCWGAEGSASVVIDPLPTPVTAGGSGAYCGSSTITASNGGSGIIYFQGTTSGGTSTATPSVSQVITSSGTYYFRARSSAGCWGNEDSVTVTVNPLPAPVTASGGGTFCASTTITAANGGDGTIYYQGTTSGGTFTATPSVSQVITASGTYYFRAQSTAGCWGPEGSVTVTINPSPTPVTVSGGGAVCSGAAITAANGGSGTIYFQGTTSGGTSTALPSVSELVTTSGTYYFRAQSSAGCWGVQGSVTVTINPLPAVYSLNGGGSYCATGAGVDVALSGSETGVNYQLYKGLTIVGGPVAGTGAPLDFGMQTSEGIYTIVARNATTLCSRNMPGADTISIYPLPTVYTVTGGGNYCAGDTGVHIGLSGSAAGIRYQLYKGILTVGSPLSGTGSALDFGLQTSAGAYTVVAENTITHCQKNMMGSASVVINPLPVAYLVSGGGHYCTGGAGLPVMLSASNTGISYQLYNGTITSGSPMAGGAGTPLDFGLQTLAGTYAVVATNATTGCTATMTGAAIIAVDPLPVAYTVTGGGSYCSGGLGIAVGLSGSVVGINYQLYRDGIISGSAMSGTGAILDFGMHTTAGNYTVVASNATTGCTKNTTSSAVIIVNPLPVVYSTTGGGSYCAGGTGVHIGLSASQAGIRYYLYKGTILSGASLTGTGAPLDFGLRNLAGTYTVYAADTTTTCTQNMSGSAVVAITPLVFPSVAISSDNTNPVCAGELVTLTATPVNGGSAPVYQWVKNTVDMGVSGNTFHIIPANGDVVAVNMTSNATCASAGTPGSSVVMKVDTLITGSLSIAANPGTEITPGQHVTFRAMMGTVPAPVYQWTINSTVIAGATSATYISSDLSNGDSVSVRVFSGNSCGDQVFSAFAKMHVGNVGVSTLASSGDIRIVPNPNKGEFTIKGSMTGGADEEVLIEISNMLGQVIYKDKVVAQNGTMNEHIHLSGAVANGMYILNLHSGGENKVFHIVVGQ